MKQFSHLLLTRFNVAFDIARCAHRLDSNWLAERLVLFERYCLPSVQAQKSAEFRWLIFCDAGSPKWFKEKISGFGPRVLPVYIDGPATDAVLARSVMDTGLVTSPYLVTTRLDNDDAISEDHLISVQAAFRSQEREFITFPLGLQSFRGHLYNVYWPSNPFLSLIEKVGVDGQVRTVLSVAHDHIGRENRVRKILGSAPQWLQVLHGANLGNALRGWPRLNSTSHRKFHVFWPEQGGPDSVGSRIRHSLRVYGERADRFVKKLSAKAS
jgi:Putative rhamnosyl transferase